MKRTLTLLALAVGAMAFAAAAIADDGHHDGDHHALDSNVFRLQTTLASSDTGTCGQNTWATETLHRTYAVRKNADGSYTMIRYDRGTFTTVAGASPGKCETTDHHGSVVTAGITGHVMGFIAGKVTGGTFNPHATCATVCDRTAFLNAFFGSGAQFSCDTDQSCKYAYVYHSRSDALKYHGWLDAGVAKDGVLHAVDRGDIATA